MNEVIEALEFLGLNPLSTKEQIIARTKKLRSVYEDSDTLEDMAKLSEILKASQIILSNYDLLNQIYEEKNVLKNASYNIGNEYVQTKTTSLEAEKNYQNLIQEEKDDLLINDLLINNLISPRQKKKKSSFGIIAGVIFLLVVAISIPLGINYIREDRYENIEAMMMNVQNSNINSIGDEIDKLPYNYRDIETIKNQYQMILREVTIIRNSDVKNDYEKMRIAYYNLVLIDNTTYTWNLSKYLESVDNRVLLYYISWSNGTYTFRLSPDQESASQWLSADLPNDKKTGVAYNFFAEDNYTIYGYVNRADSNDKFYAYEIVSISEDEIKIYCYSNKQTYTLFS